MLNAITRTFERLPIAAIDEPVLPARSSMDEEKLDELVASIRAIGLVQPIAVARVGDRYEVLAGHRRRIACARAGLLVVECMVYPSKDDFLEAVKFAENRHREDLNPADEAIWFSELLEQRCGGDIEQLAAIVGEKVSYLDNRLRLFHGSQDVFAALRAGAIKIGVAHELNKITDPHYGKYYLEHAAKSGASIATVTGWVQEWRNLFTGPARPVVADTLTTTYAGAPRYDPNFCHVCQKSDPRRMTVEVRVHASCLEAILDPLLEASRGGGAADEGTVDPRRI